MLTVQEDAEKKHLSEAERTGWTNELVRAGMQLASVQVIKGKYTTAFKTAIHVNQFAINDGQLIKKRDYLIGYI